MVFQAPLKKDLIYFIQRDFVSLDEKNMCSKKSEVWSKSLDIWPHFDDFFQAYAFKLNHH